MRERLGGLGGLGEVGEGLSVVRGRGRGRGGNRA